MTELAKFYDMLNAHDWAYVMASGDAYYKGAANHQKILKIADESDDHMHLYQGFAAHYAIRGSRGPKPEMPDEN